MYFFNKNFAIAFALIFLAELVSLAGFVWPLVNSMAFFVLVIAALAVSFIKLEYGILILLVELFVGSKGYLFSLDLGGLNISIRMALWLVVISVFAAKLTVQKEIRQNYLNGLKQSGLIFYFIILFFFIAGAVINGLARGHGYLNVFFDANGWLYFLLLFPLYGIFFTVPAGERYKKVFSVFTTAVSWLSLKTFFLLYVFSHNLAFVRPIYRWVRDSGVGEITLIQGGFYRIFFQSHIYLIPAAFLFFMLLLRAFIVFRERNESGQKLKKQSIFYFLFFSFFLSVNLVTFSRSNWLGLTFGGVLIGAWLIYQYRTKQIFYAFGLNLAALLLSVCLIAAVVKFPYPDPLGGFNTADLLKERAGQIAGEAGASSRWSLLPELWREITSSPWLGRGYGASVTYRTSDPRLLAVNPDGEYTTYAFEWGWLDTWLKLGFFGLLAYLSLISAIFLKGFAILNIYPDGNGRLFLAALFFGLAAISAVNIFSPYFNHPLGIGYLLLVAVLVDKSAKE